MEWSRVERRKYENIRLKFQINTETPLPTTKIIMPIINERIPITKIDPVAFRLRKASIWVLLPLEKLLNRGYTALSTQYIKFVTYNE